MNEHQKETDFLEHIILYGDADERLELEKRIAQVQRDQRCVKRAISVMAVFPLLMVAGLAYGKILEDNFPYAESPFFVKVICELGLASLICLAVFASVWAFYHRKLNRLREECRQLVRRFLMSRLGHPHIAQVSPCGVCVELDVGTDAADNSGSPIGEGTLRKPATDDLEQNHQELMELATMSKRP